MSPTSRQMLLSRIKELEEKAIKDDDIIMKLRKNNKKLKTQKKKMKVQKKLFLASQQQNIIQARKLIEYADDLESSLSESETSSEQEPEQEMSDGRNLDRIVPELVLKIASYLSGRDLVRLSHVHGHLLRTLNGATSLWTRCLNEIMADSPSTIIPQVLDKMEEVNPNGICSNNVKNMFMLSMRALDNWTNGSYTFVRTCKIDHLAICSPCTNVEEGLFVTLEVIRSFFEIHIFDMARNELKKLNWVGPQVEEIRECSGRTLQIVAAHRSAVIFTFRSNFQRVLTAVRTSGNDNSVTELWTRRFDSVGDVVDLDGNHLALLPKDGQSSKELKVLEVESGLVVMTAPIRKLFPYFRIYRQTRFPYFRIYRQTRNWFVCGYAEDNGNDDTTDIAVLDVKELAVKNVKIWPITGVKETVFADTAGDRLFLQLKTTQKIQIWDLCQGSFISEVSIGYSILNVIPRGPKEFLIQRLDAPNILFAEVDNQFQKVMVQHQSVGGECRIMFGQICEVIVDHENNNFSVKLTPIGRSETSTTHQLKELTSYIGGLHKDDSVTYCHVNHLSPTNLIISISSRLRGIKHFVYNFLNI